MTVQLEKEFHTYLESHEAQGINGLSADASCPFIPFHVLRDYFTLPRIYDFLSTCGVKATLATTVQNAYLRVFATLILIRRTAHISYFIQEDHSSDDFLPFWPLSHPPYFLSPERIDFFESFYHTQWQFCALEFESGKLMRDLDLANHQILPITKKELLKEGATGATYKITLHDDCNLLSARDEHGAPITRVFVLKSYSIELDEAKTYYYYEIEAFKFLMAQKKREENIITFYGSWRQGTNNYNVLLEYADQGTLVDYFERTEPPTVENDRLQFWSALLDVVKALERIPEREHSGGGGSVLEGVHQDVKPSNILVSSNGSSPYDVVFKLADLGLSHFKAKCNGKETGTKDGYGIMVYSAPEVFRWNSFVQHSDITVPPLIDVWSLGCVFSEAAVWSVFGKERLRFYRASRMAETDAIPNFKAAGYSGCFHNGNNVLSSVLDMHDKIRDGRRNNNHIMNNVLPMIEGMLDHAKSRWTAFQVYKFGQTVLREHNFPASDPYSDATDGQLNGLRIIQPTPVPSSSPIPSTPATSRVSGPGRISTYSARGQLIAEDKPGGTGFGPNRIQATSTSRRRKIYPTISIQDVHIWRHALKARAHADLLGKEEGRRLKGMDHVFLIDDSASMRDYWGSVMWVFHALAYLVKKEEPDGIDMYLANTPLERHHNDHTKDLVKKLQRVAPQGACDMKEALSHILKTSGPGTDKSPSKPRHRFRRSLSSLPESPTSANENRGLSVYVLTDGVWNHAPGEVCGVEQPIKQFVSKLSKDGELNLKVGIQFIQFGNDKIGSERLGLLDHGLEQFGIEMDIVDTVPSTGNIWKMLLGAFDRGRDDYNGTPKTENPKVTSFLDVSPTTSSKLIPKEPQGISLEQPHTDSGYGSRAHNYSTQTYSSAERYLKSMSEQPFEASVRERTPTPTDREHIQKLGLYTTETVYSASETSTLPAPRDKSYITDLAVDLFSIVQSCEADKNSLTRISELLPDLLRAFALKLGRNAQTSMHRDVSFFVHKYRRRIQSSFEDMIPLEEASSPVVFGEQPGQYLIDRYFEEPDFDMAELPQSDNDLDSASPSPEPSEDENTPDDLSDEGADLGLYRDFILKTPAYSWLIATLKRELNLSRAKLDLMEGIRRDILSTLPSSHEVSRKKPSLEYKATFELNWNPISFVKKQQYSEDPHVALERAITLTGSKSDAQAMMTMEYMAQTWPATGTHVLQLVAKVVHSTTDHYADSKLPDGTELAARIDGSKFVVTTIGTGDSLAEVGQQFAWLGAALRSSPFEAGVAMCSPTIQTRYLGNNTSPDRASESVPFAEILCVIDFEMRAPATGRGPASGECWHSMFRNPVMVTGYPIMAKTVPGLGMEISIHMIAILAGSERANEFEGKLVIKGFSTMLIATKTIEGVLVWHYFYNSKGERISYLDHTVQDSVDIDLSQLGSKRHVVGWCSDSTYYAGATDARYDVDGTGLPPPHAGCVLEKVTISAGKFITGGMMFAVGVKDVPPHISSNSYIGRLRSISKKYVVLWDEADKRGWLVNGTSALLHLVRASLEHYSKDEFSSSFLFDPGALLALAEHKPNSAAKVLSNDDNKELKLYRDKNKKFEEEEEEAKQTGSDTGDSNTRSKKKKKKRSFYLFENLVEQHYNVLEQIIDHQKRAAGHNGVNIKLRARKNLEGWDFHELATDQDPSPRVATLQALGYGWVDFIRSIGAVTLFGRGFGEIIRPVEFDGMCPLWRSLPTQKYYLAASVFDLKNIMTKFGNKHSDPPKLVQDLLWHCPGEIIAKCRCQGRGARQVVSRAFNRHHDPVQVFYPKRSRLLLPMLIQGPAVLEDKGAVVFGHSVTWGYRWRESPKEEDDLEEGDAYPPLQSPQHSSGTASLGAISGLFARRTGAQPTSSSSSSRETKAVLMTQSSISPVSTQSTPVESFASSAQAIVPGETLPTRDLTKPSRSTVLDKITSRTLRPFSTQSTPVGSSASSAKELYPVGPRSAYDDKEPYQSIAPENYTGKTLRREKRRL
jgi:serine/threonine protein kinase